MVCIRERRERDKEFIYLVLIIISYLEQIPPVALSAKLEDINGKVTSLKNILIGNRPMIVVFVRHFGCVLCRLVLAKLRGISPQLLRMYV